MPQNAIERTVATFIETVALGSGPATGWDADATVIETLVLNPDVTGLKESVVQNEQVRRRGYGGHLMLHGLRNESTCSFGMYATGSNVTTAADTISVTFQLADLLYNGMGGQHLGYAAAVVTPSTTAPDITVGQGVNHPAGAFIFGWNTAASAGQFACVDSVAVDVLTLRTDLDATANAVGAVIVAYPNTRAIFDRTHANHITHSVLLRGEDTDDNYEALGCKFNVTLENMDIGAEATFNFEALPTTFNAETLSQSTLSGTPQGPTGPIVGRSGTSVRIANLGTSTLVDVGAYLVTPTIGVVNKRVGGMAAGGVLGHNGNAEMDGADFELMIPYDDAWITDYRNDQLKHIMVQVGDQRGDAYGIYIPRAMIMEEPERGNQADETSMRIKFRALEFVGTTHAEGTNNYELERSRFSILMCA